MSRFSIMIGADSLTELRAQLDETVKAFGAGIIPATVTGTPAAATAAPKPAARQRKAAEEAPAPVAAPAAAPAAPVADDASLKKVAIAKLVTLINANDALGRNGKQVCADLCNTFGGKNVSAISADKYPALIKAVDAALTALNEDPAA